MLSWQYLPKAMAQEKKYRLNPEEERTGCYVKYVALLIAVVLVILVIVAIVLLVYFLHPGWPCPTTTIDGGLPPNEVQPEILFDGRLPDTLKPVNYRAKFTPYLDEEDGDKRFFIDGEVAITVNCIKSTSTITLHALNLDIDRNTVAITEGGGGGDVPVKDTSVDEGYEFFIIKTTKTLESGKQYIISMTYVGLMNNTDFLAFFLNVYEEDGETKYAMASQLETTFARRALPCFDEPALKATFDISIKHRTKRWALCNMPIISNETDGDWNTAHFDTTPVMPIYLLAVVVSDFVYKETTTALGVKFRVWAPPSRINSTDFALDVGVRSLDYFEDLLKIPYPLPKLDMVSLPVFNKYGAMENWGLILYKHDWMLYDKAIHHPPRGQKVSRIIAHELAHMWFGNWVTTKWWTDIWLNEGFARHFEFVAVNEVLPEWDIYSQFYPNDVIFKAMDDDATGDSHPTVQQNVGWSNDSTLFNTRVYERGCHIIRMMRSFLPDPVLFPGLITYLSQHNYSSAVSDDLWAALTPIAKEGGINVDTKEIMEPWLVRIGFPLVTISRDDVNQATVSQRFFQLDPDEDFPAGKEYTWYIPLTFTYSSNPDFSSPALTWINKTSGTIDLSGVGSNDWILANINYHGYYRINYDSDNWNKLIDQLKTDHKSIPMQNRAGLIDDAFNLARSGDVLATLAMRLIAYLEAEEDFSPWKATIRNLQYVKDMLETSPSYGNLQSYIRDLIRPRYEDLGWDFMPNDTHRLYYLRLEAIRLSCEMDNEDCINEARDIYSRWMDDKDGNSIRDDIRGVVMCTAIKYGDYSQWKFAYEEFSNTDDYFLQTDIAFGLACTPRLWLLDMYLADFLQKYKNESSKTRDYVEMPTYSTTHGPANDFYRICEFIRDQSPVGFLVAWDFVRDHFEELRAIDENQAFESVWNFASRMNTVTQQNQLEDFARKYSDMPQIQVTAFYKALRQIKANIKWMSRNYGILEEWLQGSNYM